MNDQQFDKFFQLMAAQTATLDRIAGALEVIALSNAPAPNFARDISEYPTFDFTAIGATEVARDQHGATEVVWGGYKWLRRSPQNKFGEAIWFSRPVGKDGDGNVKYARLITFKKSSEAEPLPSKVAAQVEASSQKLIDQPAASSKPAAQAVSSPPPAAEKPNGNGTAQPRYEAPVEALVAPEWPETPEQFESWKEAHRVTGKMIYNALGTDIKGWFKQNAGKGYAGLTQTLATTLAVGQTATV